MLAQRAGERLLLTLWIGALWSIGYLAVPLLFASLDDRVLAGAVAGRLFTAVSYLGLVCGGLLLLGIAVRRGAAAAREPRAWILSLMLVLVGIGEFLLQPMMASLKTQGLAGGSHEALAFARLHGVASVLYLVNSVSGLALVLWPERPVTAA